MSQKISLKKQLDVINKSIVAKMTALQQKQKAVLQMLNVRNEKKEIDKIKEKINALN